MERLKDFLYDKSDILVALIIVLVAGLVITGRINVIMTYPQTLAEKSQGNVLESDLTKDKHESGSKTNGSGSNSGNVIEGAPNTSTSSGIDKDKDKDKDNADSDKDSTTGGKKADDNKTAAPHSLYIAYGSSTTKIADDLVSGGILTDKSEFLDAVTAAGAENKLKAGNFVIPAKASAAEIVAIITK